MGGCLGNEVSHNTWDDQNLKADKLLTCFILSCLPASSVTSCIHNVEIITYFVSIKKHLYACPRGLFIQCNCRRLSPPLSPDE